MAKIVGVHGIAQEFRGENIIHSEWLPALKDGLKLAGKELESDTDFRCAFYGDLFRGNGRARAIDIPNYDESDVGDDWEKELLLSWWQETEQLENNNPNAARERATPRIIQRALTRLSESRFFGSIAEKFVVFYLKQVGGYLHDTDLKKRIQDRVIECIDEDTRVLVAHSLGSIVCYEILCRHPEWPAKAFVTIGSPLGIRQLIFDRLVPSPRDNVGCWPGNVERWVNIADNGDVVALTKQLNPLFERTVEDKLVYNGSEAHDAKRYLTAVETGEAILAGLSD
jgi:pimeloyl-ACP methyl ester carboxylesterase